MPQYTFHCQPCNLQFKKRLVIGDYPEYKCPACKKKAPRKLEAFGFGFAEGKGTALANSGVSKHDYPTADQIVGRSAEKRWSEIEVRNEAKAKFREETGAMALSRQTIQEGNQEVTEYRALQEPQFKARKKMEARFKKEIRERGLKTSVPNSPDS